MKTSDQINEIAKAMAKIQNEMRPASKSAKNPFFKSTYSDIASIWDSFRDPMTKYEVTVWQDVISTETNVSVLTRLVHSSGQWVEFGPITIPLVKKDAQAVGSAISYAKRYALSASIGVVSGEEDDDGESAVGRGKSAYDTKPTQVQPDAKVDEMECMTLEDLFSKTDETFQKNFSTHMKNVWGIADFKDLKKEHFNTAFQGMQRNIEKNKAVK